MVELRESGRIRSRRLPTMMMLGSIALLVGAAEATAGDGAVSNPVELQPLQALTATHERPLFSPTRRPPPKIVAPVAVVRQEPPPPPPPPPSLVLLGIVSENGEARASIRPPDKRPTDKALRVRAGDDVSGWKVEKIEPRRLVLTQGERSADFVLFAAAGKSVKSADASAPGRPAR
jgi:hypothetical protein